MRWAVCTGCEGVVIIGSSVAELMLCIDTVVTGLVVSKVSPEASVLTTQAFRVDPVPKTRVEFRRRVWPSNTMCPLRAEAVDPVSQTFEVEVIDGNI